MVSSVTSSPYYSYLNQLQGISDSAATPAAKAVTGTSSASGSSTAQSLVSSLLNGGNGFSSEALSLLQQNSSGSFDPITTLLGGTGTNDGLTDLYTNLYDAAAAASLTEAQEGGTPVTSSGSGASTATAPAPTSAQSLINAQTQASIAYNQTLVQNAQNIAAANAYGPDGVTKLIS